MKHIFFALVFCALAPSVGAQEWATWGGDPGGSRYSPLDQINTDNVDDLEIAWQVRTGAVEKYSEIANTFAGYQVNPILLPEEAGRHLVICTPFNDVIAFDPESGAERWRYDPKINMTGYASENDPQGKNSIPFKKCRGVSLWQDSQASNRGAFCASRIVFGTNDLRLVALDAKTGAPCPGFGENGVADVEPLYLAKKPAWRHEVKFYSPPAIIGDIMVIGTSVRDNHRANAPAGTIRAFDVRTGAEVWAFDPIPRDPSDPVYGEWDGASAQSTGGGNVWSLMSVDEERDLVFLPTSGPSPDFYGGTRPGDNRYSTSLVALRGSTGEVVWHFQTVHHDVWDYDNAAQPVLVDLVKDGKSFPAVIQATKTSMLYIFHRETGEPYFEIEERPVPTDGVLGDVLSPTQPFPVAPPPLSAHDFSFDEEFWLGFGACADKYKGARVGPIFTPPTTEGTIVVPATAGGVNWASVAIHKPSKTLVTNVLNLLHFVQLVPNEEIAEDMGEGDGNIMDSPRPLLGTPYHLKQGPVLSPYFTPCNAPPWAKLVAVDLEQGTIKWESPLGTIDKLSPVPLPIKWGAPSFSGGIVTGGGLVFIGATADNRFRAFDVETGDEIWTQKLPKGSFAHPMTYEVNGKQYVVVASGGHPFVDQDPGDYLTAFALPD